MKKGRKATISVHQYRLGRRELVSSAIALTGLAVATSLLSWGGAKAAPKLESLDPVDPDMYFGTTGSYFGGWPNGGVGGLKMSVDMPMMLADVKQFGLQGFEPYSVQIEQFLGDPMKLHAEADKTGVVIVDVGDLAVKRRVDASKAQQAGAGAYPWLGDEGNKVLIAEMIGFARNFLAPLHCDHWKTNMGARPPGGPSDDQLKGLADTLNEIGRQTIEVGVRLAPHPHIWGPMEREHEFRRIMELTDPKYVWLTLDTGHNVLGGMDPVKIVAEYFPRLAEVHLKDTYRKYRGNHSTPTRAQFAKKSLYTSLGVGGGVDFPGVFKVLRDRRFKGWAMFDIDAPRPGDRTGTVDDNIVVSVNYLRDKLHVKLPPPPAKGLFNQG